MLLKIKINSLMVKIFVFSFVVPHFLFAEPINLSEDMGSAGLVAVPVSCGDNVQLLTGVSLAYEDEQKKADQQSIFPLDVKEGFDRETFAGLGRDMSTKNTFSSLSFGAAQVSPDMLEDSDGGKFLSSSLKEIAPLDGETLVQKGNEERLARMLLRDKGVEFDSAPDAYKKAALEHISKGLENRAAKNYSEIIKQKVDCGNGRLFEMELVSKNLSGYQLDENDKFVHTRRTVVCKPEDAATDASCLNAYRKSLQDFKNSGKPMFAFTGPSTISDVAAGAPEQSTLSRHSSASPGSLERRDTSMVRKNELSISFFWLKNKLWLRIVSHC